MTGRVCMELLKVEPMLWRFMEYPGLDLTNNTAERALRPYVIWRKTSFFSQSEHGHLFRARIMTVTESCRPWLNRAPMLTRAKMKSVP